MDFNEAWANIMGSLVLPTSEAGMRLMAEAFFVSGKLAQSEEQSASLDAAIAKAREGHEEFPS